MFKGTHVIGTRDYEKDVRLIDEQERVREEMRAELSKMRLAQRRGEIDDLTKPESRTPRYRELEARFDSLVAEQRANMIKNEFELVLQKNGATMINAFTMRGHDRLLRDPAGEQARAVVLDRGRPAQEPRVPRVLLGARRGLRGAAPRPRVHAHRQVRRVPQRHLLGREPLLLGRHRLAERPGEHHQGPGRRLLRDLLRAAEPDRHADRRLRPEGGAGAGREVPRLDPAGDEARPRDDHRPRSRRSPRSASTPRPRPTRPPTCAGTRWPSCTRTSRRCSRSPSC